MADTLRGAFVSFMETVLLPLPNVIVFQFNPETIEHTWTVSAGLEGQQQLSNPLAVKGYPGEAFSFTLALDSGDMIADGSPVAQGIAKLSGVYTRVAALEMLLYPQGQDAGGLLGSVSVSAGLGGVSAAIGGAASTPPTPVPQLTVTAVLFVWGPGRIVPVRVTSLTFTEKIFDGLLNPTHVEAKIGLRILTPDELDHLTGPLKLLCKGAYVYSQGLRQALATANLANSAESIIGMLPV
jgi:hypothetical protein